MVIKRTATATRMAYQPAPGVWKGRWKGRAQIVAPAPVKMAVQRSSVKSFLGLQRLPGLEEVTVRSSGEESSAS